MYTTSDWLNHTVYGVVIHSNLKILEKMTKNVLENVLVNWAQSTHCELWLYCLLFLVCAQAYGNSTMTGTPVSE